jgi:hypothetical protein
MSILRRIQRSIRRAADWSQANMRKLLKRSPADAMAQITGAADGLFYSSESDYPLQPFVWKTADTLSPVTVLKQAGLPPETPVAQVEVESFFAPMLRVREGASPEAQERARRFARLVALLRKSLSDLTVFKVGTVEKPVYIAGRLANGNVAGLRTTVVET